MNTPISDRFSPMVAQVRDEAQLKRQIVRFTQALGFETVGLIVVLDRFRKRSEFHVVDNTPAAYLDSYHDPCLGLMDPVMQHCKTSFHPVIWDQRTYVSAQRGNLWEFQAKFGFCAGIALATHHVGGRHIFLGVDRDRAFREPSYVLNQAVAELRDFAQHAGDAALRIFDPSYDEKKFDPQLLPVEIEMLKWSMDGMPTLAIADATGLAQDAVEAHLSDAVTKLRCVSKYHAAIKAMRLGYFS